MNNKERIEKLILDFIDHTDFDEPMKGSYKLWEEIFKDSPSIEELAELKYIGLFVATLDACVALCLIKEDMVVVEGVNADEATEHLHFRGEELYMRLKELFVKIIKDRIIK